jgi:hypothetical protein
LLFVKNKKTAQNMFAFVCAATYGLSSQYSNSGIYRRGGALSRKKFVTALRRGFAEDAAVD